MRMREVVSAAELRRVCDDDGLVMWAAQDLEPGVRAWRRGDAVAVASPYLSCRDRLAVHGPAAQVAVLVREVLPVVGWTYRPVGDADLVHRLADRVPGLELARTFGWMEVSSPPGLPLCAPLGWPGGSSLLNEGVPHPTPPMGSTSSGGSRAPEPPQAEWLDPRAWSLVAELLYDAYPHSYAHPGLPGVRRWAGVLDSHGDLAAVAADAWSATGIGYLAGVATRPSARRRGYGEAVIRLVLGTLVSEHGRAGLMVDAANRNAIGLYERLGMRWRDLASACVAVRSSAA